MQFYIFNKNIMSDTHFFTNFNQLVNGVAVSFENGELKYDPNDLYHYCLSDMLIYDRYRMFIIAL
jgi:hypothetical protein